MENENKAFNADKHQVIRIIITLMLLLLMVYILKEQIDNLNILELMRVLRDEPNSTILIMAVAGIIAVMFTTLYDIVLCKDLKIKSLNKVQIFKISWISNTINNFIGFGGVSGGGLRTVFYKSHGVDLDKSVSISVITWMSALSGLSALTWLNLKFLLSTKNTLCIVVSILLALYIPVYLIIDKFIDKIPFLGSKFVDNVALKLPIKIKVHMILVATLDWFIAGMFFSILVKYFVPTVAIEQCLAIFTLATAIGICSFIPGGVGAFELACLYGFDLIYADITRVLLAILIYRIFYFVIPCLLSLFILIEEFISKKFKSKLNLEQLSLTNDLGIKALAAIVFLSGILLILSACLPIIIYKHKILSTFLNMPMLQFSQISIMGIGIILIMLSKGILNKVKISYYITVAFLLLGALLSLIKGLNIQSSIWLIVVAILLYLSKERFYRESYPLKLKNVWILIISIISTTFIYAIIYNSILNNAFLRTHIKHLNSLMYSPKNVFYFLTIMALSMFILSLLMVKRPNFKEPTEEDMIKLQGFLNKYGGNSKSHLLFLKDKILYYCEDNEVLIPFRVIRDKAIILGDPIGNKKLIGKAINDFRKYLDKYNMTPVFYEVEEEYLPIYHDNGYTFLKLGEEAVINLETFNLDGKAKQDLRTINNKMKKGALNFEILKPPFNENLLERLEEISEQWLGDRKEKGFSLGWFDKIYLNKAPIAIIKKDEQIVGFATLAPMYDNVGLTIDLMRIIPKPPNGAMDGLFLGIIIWAKENGYKKFSLGVAPLSNVGVNEFSRTSEKIAKNIYKYGGRFYKFSGLRKYKEKFSPEWSSRYLAYPKKIDLPITIMDVIRMVSNSRNN